MLLPSEAGVHKHRETPCYGGPHNRATAEFVYYMAHIENAARIINWGLFAHHWADRLPDKERRVIANNSVMKRFGRRKHSKFANLYFGTHTAMQYVLTHETPRVLAEKDLVFLRFDSDELFGVEGVKFSDGNVARHETSVYSAEDESDELNELAWNIILCQKKKYLGEKLKRMKMAELLVPHYIPPNHIHSAVVLNSESEERLKNLIETVDSEEFTNAIKNIFDDPDFVFEEDYGEYQVYEEDQVDIIRDGSRRHFFGQGDGDGGYNVDNEWSIQEQLRNIKLPDPEDYL